MVNWRNIEMRLDKFLTECGLGSRREVKEILRTGEITVNGIIANNPQMNIKENSEDNSEQTVMELLPDWVIKKDLVPVGRLDKDTEGLLLLTNDGALNHKLLSPKSHVEKTYYADLEKDILEDDLTKLRNGLDIGGYITMPAKASKVDSNKIHLTIKEGKFHQVKKMLEAVGNKVVFLKRISFGKLNLDNLELGEVKEINSEDII